MLKELYPANFRLLNFENSKEWLPFFGSNKKAITEMSNQMVKLNQNEAFFAYYDKNRLLFVVGVVFKQKNMEVNYLLEMSSFVSLTDYQVGLENIAKKRFVKKIILKLVKQSIQVEEQLKKMNYDFIPERGYVTSLHYQTGLVLGGGGAKGAYQIGVWHALKEMGISFDMISGTSVGALNGGLILQDDLETAEKMWRSIATEKILQLPKEVEGSSYSINQLINDMQKLTKTAIQEKGVSTEPLFSLIKELIHNDKIFNSHKKFYLVTTETPKMEEKVVSLEDMTTDSFPKWLLASSSFFPAMQACQIDGIYYVDGGYRNNVPKDVLVKQGATEIIVVDVSGPGITKPYKVPKNIVEIDIKSSWGLGNVLLFDGNRSNWNINLGYLETKKILGYYQGYDYTFSENHYKQKSLKLSREFYTFLRKVPKFLEWFKKKTTLKPWDWLLKNKIEPEFLSILLLESLAKKAAIQPTTCYQIEDLASLVVKEFEEKSTTDAFSLDQNMMYSLSEWLTRYIQKKVPITDFQLTASYYHYFKEFEDDKSEMYDLLMDVSWRNGLEALFLIFLEMRNS